TRDREDIARTDGHAAARPHNSSSGDHPLAPSGREKVYLVLDGQDRGAGWHQSHGRVAASYVDNRRDNGSGEEAVMLREILSKRQVDLNFKILSAVRRCPVHAPRRAMALRADFCY